MVEEQAEQQEEEEEETDARPAHERGALLAGVFNSLPTSKRFWNLLAGGCLIAAAVAVLTGHADAAFVIATLGILAWFIEKRNHWQGKIKDGKSSDEHLKDGAGKSK